ncbi:Major intracellular serine protease [Madurella mycetomatis]|uniref:Major intracellular serine protease n=1 Tax=Madurella mycetomatis TaxID=100816 RepID=A0A175WHL0_9PEZI|nr:Major intracellular serine protease [Madurella mycetomatis]KXX82989.1 Major intracellular serine protease [Madurella mycetomatis]
MEQQQLLDQALDKILDGQANQGIEEWEKCFRDGRDKTSPTVALFQMADLAATLAECDLLDHARQVDQQIMDQLDEDKDSESPLVSPENRAQLYKTVDMRYADEAKTSSLTNRNLNGSFSNRKMASHTVVEYPTRFTLISTPSQQTTHHFGGDNTEAKAQVTTVKAGDRAVVVTSDEVNPGRHRVLPRYIPNQARKAAEEFQPPQIPPSGSTEQENELFSPDQDGLFLASNTTTTEGSSKWLTKFSNAVRHLGSPNLISKVRSGVRVNIAILDTGCDITDPYFRSHGIEKVDELKRNWHDCLRESREPTDQDAKNHGTALSILLLLLAPEAAAVLLAAERGIDIISMSFGFEKDINIIQKAIIEAESKTGNKIVFFAAANNSGQDELERFPARSESVISVRGTDYRGGIVAPYNPPNWPYKPRDQFCTLAKDVPCGFFAPKSGCSVATVIMAAIAAAVIGFVEQESHFTQAERSNVRTRRGLVSVFSTMAAGRETAKGRWYVAPWQLFENNRKPLYIIGSALSLIPQQG